MADIHQKIAGLEHEIRELKANAGRAPEPDNGLPRGHYRDFSGIERNGRGEVVRTAEPVSDEDRARAWRNAEVRRAAEHEERITEGLPKGQFRDPCGIVRNRITGTIVVSRRET